MMASLHIGSVVVTEDDQAVGLVTDRDLALQGMLGEGEQSEMTLDTCTSKPLITLPVDSQLQVMARTLRVHGVRRAVLVDDAGAPVGMLSADDLLSYLGREVGQLATAIQREFQEEAAVRAAGHSTFGPE